MEENNTNKTISDQTWDVISRGVSSTWTYANNQYKDFFDELITEFNINITDKQRELLDNLISSGDHYNRIMAASIFRNIMKNQPDGIK